MKQNKPYSEILDEPLVMFTSTPPRERTAQELLEIEVDRLRSESSGHWLLHGIMCGVLLLSLFV